MRRAIGLAVLLLGLGLAAPALADAEVRLTIRDHRFQPTELQAPPGVKIKILIKNEDPTAEEFESTSLHREKVVPPGQEVAVFVGPLEPGTYGFFGDFHQDTAQGRLVVK